jgi:hypothetical protein
MVGLEDDSDSVCEPSWAPRTAQCSQSSRQHTVQAWEIDSGFSDVARVASAVCLQQLEVAFNLAFPDDFCQGIVDGGPAQVGYQQPVVE